MLLSLYVHGYKEALRADDVALQFHSEHCDAEHVRLYYKEFDAVPEQRGRRKAVKFGDIRKNESP